MKRMNRKRLRRRVWHGCSSPSDVSKSERSWRRLSKCLCYEVEFDEMKRTCAYCGKFEDEDDILVRCQGPNCSLRSVDYELPGLFHGRCAAALGYSGSAHWRNCPWCPPAKHAENFEKPDDLSSAIDEHFEKFDEPDKKHESDEYVCGKWASEKSEASIFWHCNMNCLSFEESVDDSGYLHGWLDRNSDGWQARLAFHDMHEDRCYLSSCGEEPEYVGDIHVRLLSETAIETQIKFSDDDEWQPPVVLTLQHRDGSSERNWFVPLPERRTGAATVDGVIVPPGCDETLPSELAWYSA